MSRISDDRRSAAEAGSVGIEPAVSRTPGASGINKKRLCIVAVLYMIILAMNLIGLPRAVCDWGNHVFVFACLIFCVSDWGETKDNSLLAFMILTFAADVLSGFSAAFAWGVVFFFASQIVMSHIIWKNNGARRGWLLRVLLTAAGLTGITAAGLLSPFYAFGVVYFMWFAANTVQAVMAQEWTDYNVNVRAAMVLYLIGDICLIANLLVPEAGMLRTVLAYGTWMPYLPAVYMIAVSSRPDR